MMEFSLTKTHNFGVISKGFKFLIATCFFAFLSFANTATAQLLAVNESSSKNLSFIEDSKSDWKIYCDHENRVIYIDFEKINSNLSSLIVRDKDGRTIFKDENLWQLPVNTIYEIDCMRYEKGDYVLELRSFTSSIKKEFKVK